MSNRTATKEALMTAAEAQTIEVERIEGWRLEELERAGYDRLSAWGIAERADIDLHLAIALRRAGCAPATARRILL